MVTRARAHLFGRVINGSLQLNDAGQIARQCWLSIPEHFPHVTLDAFVIVPNHVHGIIVITENVGAKTANVGGGIGVTKWFRANTDIYVVWQRDYYDHIIRNERALRTMRRYIALNPVW